MSQGYGCGDSGAGPGDGEEGAWLRSSCERDGSFGRGVFESRVGVRR